MPRVRVPHAFLRRGIYRVIQSRGITLYIHVEDFEEDVENPVEPYIVRNPGVLRSEIMVSWGTAVLLEDELVMYTGEARHGVCLCGSRAGMGSMLDM